MSQNSRKIVRAIPSRTVPKGDRKISVVLNSDLTFLSSINIYQPLLRIQILYQKCIQEIGIFYSNSLLFHKINSFIMYLHLIEEIDVDVMLLIFYLTMQYVT